MTLGARIKLIRGLIAREKFAPIVGVSRNTLISYETDERCPGSDFLNTILDLYPEINPTWLLTGEGAMKRGEEPAQAQGTEQKGASSALELDLELLERIIVSVIKYQRETGDQTQDLLAEVLARSTASAIINTYKTCLGMPAATLNEIVNHYTNMLGPLNDNLRQIADKKGAK